MIIKSYEVERQIFSLLKYNLFLIYGENNGLKKDIAAIIKNYFKKENSNIELLNTYENDILENTENFYNSIYSGSLFSDKKIITINTGTDKLTKIIENILEKKNKSVLLIIFATVLEKKSKLRNLFEKQNSTICIPCYLDNMRDLENIAKNELKKNNITLPREAINFLVEKSNQDRDNIKNEIEKIKSYAYTKKELELWEIKSIINFSGEYKSDNLINECLSGNTPQFKKILSELYLNTVNQIFLLRILSSKTQRLLKMKELEKNYKSVDELINNSKPIIFWQEKPIIKKQLSIWNLNDLKKIIYEINSIEILCKKKPQLSKIASFDFFSKICKRANNYS